MARKHSRAKLTFAEMPEVMTPQQVQELLQISSSTFFRWVKAGQLPGAVKIGDSWRVLRDQLKDHLDQTARLPRQATPHGRSGNRALSKAESISDALQEYMQKNRMEYLKAPTAGALLEQWGLLADSRQRPGKPLRDLLRAGVITGQEQPGGPHSTWFIRRVDEGTRPIAASSSTSAGAELRVTAADLRKGQIRVPSTSTDATKELFPTAKSRVTVILRGKSTSCRWDPRKMPDGQLRSGVLHVGAVLRKLVRKDEALTATREEGGAVVID